MDTSGIAIISDGTSEGTHVLLDGRLVRGVVGARWEISPHAKRATLTLELKDVSIDASAAVPEGLREQIAHVSQQLP